MTQRCTHSPEGNAARQAATVAAGVPVIETARLRLRAPRLSDLPAWTEIVVPDTEGFLGGPFTEEDAWSDFCVYVAGWMLHGHGIWTIERRGDGETLGFVSLGLEWDDEEPELGYMLRPDHRGQGYAAEAATAARDHALALLGEGHVVSYVSPGNAASARVAERLGARRDPAVEARIGDDDLQVWRHGGTA